MLLCLILTVAAVVIAAGIFWWRTTSGKNLSASYWHLPPTVASVAASDNHRCAAGQSVLMSSAGVNGMRSLHEEISVITRTAHQAPSPETDCTPQSPQQSEEACQATEQDLICTAEHDLIGTAEHDLIGTAEHDLIGTAEHDLNKIEDLVEEPVDETTENIEEQPESQLTQDVVTEEELGNDSESSFLIVDRPVMNDASVPAVSLDDQKPENDAENEVNAKHEEICEATKNRKVNALRQAVDGARRATVKFRKMEAANLDGNVGGAIVTGDMTEAEDNRSESCSSDHIVTSKIEPDPIKAEEFKVEGNNLFKDGNYQLALMQYTQALYWCSPQDDSSSNITAVILSNRAACHLALKDFDSALNDSTDAIQIEDAYIKAYLRRFRANEGLEKWHDALADINKALELDPALRSQYAAEQKAVEKRSQDQFEKEKQEMLDKLKTFGSWALGKVGLSLDNFKLEQNAETGAYNISFQQNPGEQK